MANSFFRSCLASAALIAFVCLSYAVRCIDAVLSLFKPLAFTPAVAGNMPTMQLDGAPLDPALQNDIRFDAAHSRRSAARHI